MVAFGLLESFNVHLGGQSAAYAVLVSPESCWRRPGWGYTLPGVLLLLAVVIGIIAVYLDNFEASALVCTYPSFLYSDFWIPKSTL